MRKLLMGVIALVPLAVPAGASPRVAGPTTPVASPSVQTVQYYEPDWREREEWRRRREIEFRRREEWRHRQEWRRLHGFPPEPPPPWLDHPPPPPGYGPRY